MRVELWNFVWLLRRYWGWKIFTEQKCFLYRVFLHNKVTPTRAIWAKMSRWYNGMFTTHRCKFEVCARFWGVVKTRAGRCHSLDRTSSCTLTNRINELCGNWTSMSCCKQWWLSCCSSGHRRTALGRVLGGFFYYRNSRPPPVWIGPPTICATNVQTSKKTQTFQNSVFLQKWVET